MKNFPSFAIALSILFASCQRDNTNIDEKATDTIERNAVDNFNASEDEIRAFDFNQHSTWNGIVHVQGYDGPISGIPIQLFDKKVLLETGWTDANGDWHIKINHTASMDLKVVSQMPTISGTYPIFHDDFNITIAPTTVQSSQHSTASTSSTKTGQATVTSRGHTNWYDDRTYVYNANRDGQILPTLAAPDTLTDDFLTSIANSVPEQYPVGINNPSLLAEGSTSLHLIEAGDVWMTFVNEGAGFKNTIGIFIYDDQNVPSTTSDIDTIWTAFENFSALYSGGGLLPGDKIYIGSYPAGTYIGFALIANGYNSNLTNFKTNNTYYSIPALNPESNPDKLQHNILLFDDQEQRFVIGFEDLHRSSGTSDEDFNDALFFCSSNPPTALDTSGVTEIIDELLDSDYDGVPDMGDIAPNDPDYATTYLTQGKLMFEDLYPYLGDYDFNDMVVAYEAVAWKSGTGITNKMEFSFQLKADGGTLENGFALSIDGLDGQMVSNVVFSDEQSSFEGENEAVFVLSPDFSWSGVGMVNNEVGGNLSDQYPTLSVSFEINGARASDVFWGDKLNPFIFQQTTNNLRNEIHLKYKQPSSRVAQDSIGTGDDITLLETIMFYETDWTDGTNAMRYWAQSLHFGDSTLLPATSITYTDRNGYPWAMHLDQSVPHALERIQFTDAYPNFNTWIASGGFQSTDWFTTISTGKVFR